MPLSFAEVVPVDLFHDGAFRWRLATRSLTASAWLQFDDTVDEFLAEKQRVLHAHRGDAFAALPGSEGAGGELADLVAAALTELGRPLPASRSDQHPVEWAARGVQEDLCLLERDDAGWRFTAAAVCFPTRWSPAEKVGLDLRSVHAPVPQYDTIAATVDRFFDRLRPGALAWRPNWSLVGDDRLRLPVDDRQAPRDLPADPVDGLWLRIERQVVRRLVEHPDAAVFTVRIHRWPLRQVLREIDAGLANELRTMPADVAHYKNLEYWRLELAEALESAADGSSRG